ncbi:hypothetical protein JB92DRAFT_411009 [Gautieria morchelliformis]|nr:hypothetical protein JB92DRAFT_411009 [Gautieria morchelliformis]
MFLCIPCFVHNVTLITRKPRCSLSIYGILYLSDISLAVEFQVEPCTPGKSTSHTLRDCSQYTSYCKIHPQPRPPAPRSPPKSLKKRFTPGYGAISASSLHSGWWVYCYAPMTNVVPASSRACHPRCIFSANTSGDSEASCSSAPGGLHSGTRALGCCSPRARPVKQHTPSAKPISIDPGQLSALWWWVLRHAPRADLSPTCIAPICNPVSHHHTCVLRG